MSQRRIGEILNGHYLLAYASDFHFLFAALQPHGVSYWEPDMQVATIDHSMWFHREFRLDDWLLYVVDSPSASGGRGLVRGQFFTRDGVLLEITGHHRLAVNESNAMTAAALCGLGVAQMPAFTAIPLVARGELVQVLSDWTCHTIPLYVVYPPNRHLSAKVRAFVEWVAELFAQHPQMAH